MTDALGLVAEQSLAESVIERARGLVPAVIAGRDEARRAADLLSDTMAQIKATGLLRAFQPKRWGGMELDPRILFDVQTVLAEHCLSTAWVFGVLSVQSFILGRMDPLAQADVWADDPDMLASSSFAPVAKVVPVAGGYRISGRFTFSSGSSHAGWAIVGGMVPGDGASSAPRMRLFLVPRTDYRIDRVWDTFGLRATGSNDLVIEAAFVPAYRTLAPDSGLQPLPAAKDLAPLYRLPWLYVFASTIANVSIGAARAAMRNFLEVARARQDPAGAIPSAKNLQFQSLIGRVRVEVDLIERQSRANYGALIDHVAQEIPLPLDQALLYRAELTSFARRIATLVDEMMLALGGRGIASDGPLTQIWLDLMAARAHLGNDPTPAHSALAQDLLAASD